MRQGGPGGEQREFEALLGEHRGIVFQLANAHCRAHEERDDLVQEICLPRFAVPPRVGRRPHRSQGGGRRGRPRQVAAFEREG